MNALRRFFQIEARGTTFRREILAGLTTFTTMSYIVVVNPAILKTAGIPAGPSMTATILAAVCGCLLMGLYANRPFAIAPYMGENAFIAFTVCLGLGIRWQTALGAIFLAGLAFIVLTVLRLRQWLVESIPTSLRYSFAVGIGLFLTFIGLNQTGIVALGVAGAPVKAGALTSAAVLVAIFGFLLIGALTIRKVPGAILIGIVTTALVAFVTHVAPWPVAFFGMPASVAPIFAQIDIRGALSPKSLPIALTTPNLPGIKEQIPNVSASASRDAAGKLHISLVNTSPDAAANVACDIEGAATGSPTGRILTASDMTAHNTFDAPHTVEPRPFDGAALSGGKLTVSLPPLSVVILEL